MPFPSPRALSGSSLVILVMTGRICRSRTRARMLFLRHMCWSTSRITEMSWPSGIACCELAAIW